MDMGYSRRYGLATVASSMQKTLMYAAAASALSGCAMGYGVGTQTAHVSASPDGDTPAAKVSTTYQEFRLIDSTGILLAALVNMGRQYNARNDAMEEAQYRTPDQTGKVRVEYSYKPMPILSGLLTDMRIRVPLGAPELADGMGNVNPNEVEYWQFDVRPEFYTFRPFKSLPLVSALWLNMEAAMWKTPSINDDFDLFQLDLGFGASTSYVLRENITATGRAKIGFISPLFSAFTGGPLLNPSFEAEVGYMPLQTDKVGLMVSGVAYIGREADLDGRSVVVPRIGLNVAVTFGNQVPKKIRNAPTETPQPSETMPPAGTPAAASTGVSGMVCLGDDALPECKQVIDRSNEAVKMLYLACLQATDEAIKSNSVGSQPTVCKASGEGITKLIADNGATMTEEQKKLAHIAAATSFDFAGAGFEATAGKYGPDHCAMIEATFNHVVIAIPNRVQHYNAAVSACRGN